MEAKEALFTNDTKNKKITVVRTFKAALPEIWSAWTVGEILDKWWAPKPFKAETKSIDFTSGGHWLYCMAGPDGERHWCRVNLKTVEPNNSFISTAGFCDDKGILMKDFPLMHWNVKFAGDGSATMVTIEIQFDTDRDMQAIIGMGFQGGFTMGLNNLDELLK